jgi:drug/metabolite transporter (DMT)-like permease
MKRDIKRIALAVIGSPALLVAFLFIVRPESLGSPALKLALMAAAGCVLMTLGELSDALTNWAVARIQARVERASVPPSATVLDVLTGGSLTASPPSTRFG